LKEWRFYVYILASKSRRLYTGMTNWLFRRVMEHKSGEVEGFTKRYKINRLVYYEEFKYVRNCIAREKEIKGWSREKKVALIESINPAWEDLSADWGTRIEEVELQARKSRFLAPLGMTSLKESRGKYLHQ
jgi:putative endonuclease